MEEIGGAPSRLQTAIQIGVWNLLTENRASFLRQFEELGHLSSVGALRLYKKSMRMSQSGSQRMELTH